MVGESAGPHSERPAHCLRSQTRVRNRIIRIVATTGSQNTIESSVPAIMGLEVNTFDPSDGSLIVPNSETDRILRSDPSADARSTVRHAMTGDDGRFPLRPCGLEVGASFHNLACGDDHIWSADGTSGDREIKRLEGYGPIAYPRAIWFDPEEELAIIAAGNRNALMLADVKTGATVILSQ